MNASSAALSESSRPQAEAPAREVVTCAQRPIQLDTPAPLDPLIGTRVGNFILERRLGEGGMGAVYLGENRAIGSKVAVKFLHRELAHDPGAVRRFYDEARAANLVSHENIVRILDLGHDESRGFYLIMEYVPGRTLASKLREGPVAVAWAEQIMAQLCSALGDAHARGVVHRDLKPENILLVERASGPHVKIADFGIAKLRADTAVGATAFGEMLGTPAYMAPEQCQGLPADSRVDIYALGLIAYEMCTGRLPFEGNVARLLVAQMSQAPRPPRELRPDLPARWDSAILCALQKSPDDRFANTGAFLEALCVREAEPSHAIGDEALLEVTLAPGLPPLPLRATKLSRGGAMLEYAGTPPPLRSKVGISVQAAEARFELSAEVVLHVGAEEARAWNAQVGFAVQFQSAPPGFTAALQRVQAAAAPKSSLDAHQRELLAHYATQMTASHYELLGLPVESHSVKILERGQRAIAELRALESLPLNEGEVAQVRAGLARLASAIAALANPLTKLRYDASIGNFRGVAAALASLEPGQAEREHLAFLAARPDLPAKIEVRLARARLARAHGNSKAARAELEAALVLDPLDPGLHRMWAALGR